MLRALTRMALILTASTCLGASAMAQEPAFDRKEDVIYGRKYGTALTMDVFTPEEGRQRASASSSSSAAGSSRRTRRSIRPSSGRWSTAATRSSRWSTAASPGSRSPRSSRT